jgi:predicted O-methyltransferase YrrM
MTTETWARVDEYFAAALAPADAALDAALSASAAKGLPAHAVSALQGKLLHVLARSVGAHRILEIGTLGGYSTIWLARALPEYGHLVTLESNPAHAAVARRNLEVAGLAARVELREGPALESLAHIARYESATYDFIFIDADKPANPEYLEYSLKLARPGALLVADNVVRGGSVAEAGSSDPNVAGVRRFVDLVASEPRLAATAVQTVGTKGYDGFLIALVA